MTAISPIRVAREASAPWNLAKTLAQIAVFWSFFLFVIPVLVFRAEDALGLAEWRFAAPALRVASVPIFAAASALGLASALFMSVRGRGTPLPLDTARELVIAGPYRFVRNPMAVSGLTQGAAVGLWFGSPLVLAYVLAGVAAWSILARPVEERDLEHRFGDAFRIYRRRVLCWRPRLRGYDPAREAEEPPISADRTAPPGRHVVLYDGHCKFCQAQTKNLVRLARPGALDLRSFQEAGALDPFPGVTHAACMRAMHLIAPDGRVFDGFEAAVRAVATRPIIGLVAYGYYLPGFRLSFDLLYRAIAAYRYRLMGKAVARGECSEACAVHLPRPKPKPEPTPAPDA